MHLEMEFNPSKTYNEDLIEALFESISTNFQGGILLAGIDGRIHKINDFAQKLLSENELFAKEEMGLNYLPNLKKSDFFFQGVVKSISQNSKVIEKICIDFNKASSVIIVDYLPLKDQDLSLITFKNVQRQIEEDNFFKLILDELPADIAVFDKNHKYLFLNKMAIKDAEMRQWMIGKDDFDYCKRKGISTDMAHSRREEFNKAIQTQNAELIESTKEANRNGTDSWTVRRFNKISDSSSNDLVIGYGVDITSIHRERIRFKMILNSLNDAVLEINKCGEILYYNDSWSVLAEIQDVENHERTLFSFISDHDKDLFNIAIDKLIRGESPNGEKLVVSLITRSAKVIVEIKLNLNSERLKGSNIYCILRDVNKEKKAEEIINQLLLAVGNSMEGIAVLDANSEYTFLNRRHVETFGYSTDAELLGKSWKFIYLEDEINRIENEIFPEFGKTGYFRGHTVGVKKDGSEIHQMISLTALPDGGLICLSSDITDELQLQKELKQLAIVAEKTNSIIIIFDTYGTIEWVNKSFEDLFGYSLEEIKGALPIDFMIGPETDPVTILSIISCFKKGEQFKGEILNYSRNGNKFWLYLDITPIKNEDGNVISFIGVENNITSIKNAEQGLIESLTKEKHLNQLKSHFVNLASHEFRTPLATIQSSIDILGQAFKINQDVFSDNSKSIFDKHQHRIGEEITRMTKIMDDILIVGKLNAGKLIYKPCELSLDELIDSIILEFNLNLPEGSPILLFSNTKKIKIEGDSILLRQVFVNLISNALKYSEGMPTPSLVIEKSKEFVKVEVRDLGIGIPEDEKIDLFNSFFRASNALNIQGTGLGLVIVKQLIELHSGEITIIDNNPAGTRVIIQLPIKQ